MSKFVLGQSDSVDIEYLNCIRDLINNRRVRRMGRYMQHGKVTCLEHSLYVSYCSYLICRRLGFDYRSAARGGLLHDFFLYDWHKKKPYKGLHGLKHPYIALKNAKKYFQLNKLEQDIISKHMWPLTIIPPRYWETLIVNILDKYCAFMETFNIGERRSINRLQSLLSF
ncbi:MAG: HD family phosphohydrolase [Clostridium sp.]|nr:HD family phosphohydrolase [Clostridium sp.]